MFCSLKTRLTGAFLVVACIVATLALVSTLTVNSLADSYEDAMTERAPQLQALAHASMALSQVVEHALYGGVGEQTASHSSGVVSDEMAEADRCIAMFAQVADEEEEIEHAKLIQESLDEIHACVRLLSSSRQPGDAAEAHDHGGVDTHLLPETAYPDLESATTSQLHARIEKARDHALRLIGEAIQGELDELEADTLAAGEVKGKAQITNLVTAVLAAIVALVLGLFTAVEISRPMNVIRKATEKFGKGELDHRIEPQKLTEFQDLAKAFNNMAQSVSDAQNQREDVLHKLNEASRLAGMAEIATGVLHNVGNVLNSVNISVGRMTQKVKGSKVQDLSAVSTMLQKHRDDLPTFIEHDQQGQYLPAFLSEMSQHLDQTMDDLSGDLTDLSMNVGHIKQIVASQQSFARVKGVAEPRHIREILQNALEINRSCLKRHEVQTQVQCGPELIVTTDQHKLLQVLVNLVSNAKDAMWNIPSDERAIRIDVSEQDGGVVIKIADTGCGIPQENLTRIFEHGFTTRSEGHGFGLHTCALNMKELGGSLRVASDGAGKGATFRMELPNKPAENSGLIQAEQGKLLV